MSSSTTLRPSHPSVQNRHPFQRLPLELRTQIWHAAAQQPRTLDLWRIPIGTLTFHASFPARLHNSVQTYRFCSTRPVPAVLHINRESRAIALKHYALTFGCHNNVDDRYGIAMTAPPRTYVNWKLDTVLLLGERDDHAIPDALAWAPPEGASIAIEISKVQFDEEWNELTAIAANGSSVKEVVFYSDAMVDDAQLGPQHLRRRGRQGTVELVDLEENEEQTPELILKRGKDALEFQFQELEANVDGEYRFDYINWEEAQERWEALERRPVVRFAKLLIRDISKPHWRTAYIGPRVSTDQGQGMPRG